MNALPGLVTTAVGRDMPPVLCRDGLDATYELLMPDAEQGFVA
jgi:hypothetical protein